MSGDSQVNSQHWNFGPAIFAWLLPGWGHWLVGERCRAMCLAGGIGLLWLVGLLIGGVSVIDRQAHPAWFCAQMLTAPSIAIDYLANRWVGTSLMAQRHDDRKDTGHPPSFGRVREQGILYTSLAGLLNLLSVVDVVYRQHQPRKNPNAGVSTKPRS